MNLKNVPTWAVCLAAVNRLHFESLVTSFDEQSHILPLSDPMRPKCTNISVKLADMQITGMSTLFIIYGVWIVSTDPGFTLYVCVIYKTWITNNDASFFVLALSTPNITNIQIVPDQSISVVYNDCEYNFFCTINGCTDTLPISF